ncbi:MAG: MoaD/ThiS family protein [Candidatus Bathyarchaeia archaeon]|jgi:molybdopterin converting factor small subunit
MLVRVRLLGSLRPPGIPKEIEVEIPADSKIASLIEELSRLYPEIASSLINSSTVNLIMLEGIEVGNLEGLDTFLDQNATVIIVPVTHGG